MSNNTKSVNRQSLSSFHGTLGLGICVYTVNVITDNALTTGLGAVCVVECCWCLQCQKNRLTNERFCAVYLHVSRRHVLVEFVNVLHLALPLCKK